MSEFPVRVRSTFAPSTALYMHIERSVARSLGAHAARLKSVEVRLRDANGPRRGATDKLARVVVTLASGGRIITAGASDDLYASVTRALLRARTALVRRLDMRRRHPHAPPA